MVFAFQFFMGIGEILQFKVRNVKVHHEERLLSV